MTYICLCGTATSYSLAQGMLKVCPACGRCARCTKHDCVCDERLAVLIRPPLSAKKRAAQQALLTRQLLRYLERDTSRATTLPQQRRARTLKTHKVREAVRRMLALQEGGGSWYQRLLTQAEADLCRQLEETLQGTERVRLLACLVSPPPEEEAR